MEEAKKRLIEHADAIEKLPHNPQFVADLRKVCGVKTKADWEVFCKVHNCEPERHRTTGEILCHDGLPISKGLLKLFAEGDAYRNGTSIEEELDKLFTAWENRQ